MKKTTVLVLRKDSRATIKEDGAWSEGFALNLDEGMGHAEVVCRVGPDGEIAARPLDSEEQRDFIPMGGIEIDERHALALRKLVAVQEDADRAMNVIWSEQIRSISREVLV